MSVRILVKDRLDKPVQGAIVRVLWKGGGTSNERTNSVGIADLKCSPGTASSVYIDDSEELSGVYLEDRVIPLKHPTK